VHDVQAFVITAWRPRQQGEGSVIVLKQSQFLLAEGNFARGDLHQEGDTATIIMIMMIIITHIHTQTHTSFHMRKSPRRENSGYLNVAGLFFLQQIRAQQVKIANRHHMIHTEHIDHIATRLTLSSMHDLLKEEMPNPGEPISHEQHARKKPPRGEQDR